MPAGIEIYNDDNVFQIDGKYKNLVLVKKTTVTVQPSATNTVQYLDAAYRHTVSSSDVVVAIGCLDNKYVHAFKAGGLSYYFSVVDTAATITIYEFRKISETPVGNYGLLVYNETGELIFDALQKPMRVVAATAMDMWNPSTQITASNDIAVNSGRKYAFALSHFGTYFKGISAPIGPPGGPTITSQFICTPGVQYVTASNAVRVGGQIVATNRENFAPGNFDYGASRLTGFVIDVTHY